MRKEDVIGQIQAAFGANRYPGDGFLQGTFEGSEPYEEVSAFLGKTDWRAVDAKTLDIHYGALGFFSEAGFRFFLPAYLVADLRGELHTADPLFYLWHGFATVVANVGSAAQTFRRESGGTRLINPRRYGAMTWSEHARYRLSVFTREEAQAIVAYMSCKRANDHLGTEQARIDAALEQFWLDRAANAPSHEALAEHLQEEETFVAALQRRHEDEK